MKLVKNILTLILFTTTFLIISVAQYFTMNLITLPGGSEVVQRVHLFPDITSREVTYSDAISFWVTDVNESLIKGNEQPEYTIRGLINFSAWYSNMKWADYALTQVKAVTIPIIAPVYEIKELYTYYGASLEKFIVEKPADNFLSMDQIARNAAIETYLIKNNRSSVFNEAALLDIARYDRDAYQYVYNLLLKLEKYNRIDEATGLPVYRPYVNKFIIYNGDLSGEYEFFGVNALAAWVYYQIFLALILSAYFTYQNPIVIKRNDNNENEVEGRIFPRLPKVGFSKRNNNQNQQQYNNNNQVNKG